MKNKMTLKQKVALGFCCADLALVLSMGGLGIAGATIQENAKRKFIETAEYKQAINAQLEEINAKYADQETSLENLHAQYNDMNYVLSLKNQEKLLDASESEYGKQYDKGKTLGNIAISCGLGAIATVVATASVTIDSIIEKGKLEQTL